MNNLYVGNLYFITFLDEDEEETAKHNGIYKYVGDGELTAKDGYDAAPYAIFINKSKILYLLCDITQNIDETFGENKAYFRCLLNSDEKIIYFGFDANAGFCSCNRYFPCLIQEYKIRS
mgnify:CR=1 FL=1